jgi:hypothetical protein
MEPKYKSVLIACPGNATTAGPEAIHQLAADLNRLGCNSAVVYFPFSKKFETPNPYKKYKAPIELYRDNSDDLFIFPEIVTTYALALKKAKAAIWWMSVNNFTCQRYGNPFRDKFRYFKNFVKGLRPINGLKSLRYLDHYAQSYYASEFLRLNNLKSKILSDPIPVYTNTDYLSSLKIRPESERSDLILYNPNKGAKINEYLIQRFKNFKFFPLVGYDREALANIFQSAKLYIDFGHHPGKDRLPREAAIHGCCVITSLYGSAENALDINIPNRYKLNPKQSNFDHLFESLVIDIFNSYEICHKDFVEYRKTISNEQNLFDQQILDIFFTN